jgi:hypothetical protein
MTWGAFVGPRPTPTPAHDPRVAWSAAGVDGSAYPFTACWSAFCRSYCETSVWDLMFFARFYSVAAPSRRPRIGVGIQFRHDQLSAFLDAFLPGVTCFPLKPRVFNQHQ